jgi:sec-independent protein translocase protein TatB
LYLFIFESLGTSELIMIGIVALIFLGPRRLPEIARKAGKIMSELRGTANEFKQTWEKEVDFEEETKALKIDNLLDEADEEKPVARENSILSDNPESTPIEVPAIKAMNKEEFDAIAAAATESESTNGHHETPAEPANEEEPDLLSDKRNWL